MTLGNFHLEEQYVKSNTRAKEVVIIQSFLTWCFEIGYPNKYVARVSGRCKKRKRRFRSSRDIDEEDLRQAIDFRSPRFRPMAEPSCQKKVVHFRDINETPTSLIYQRSGGF